MGKEKGVGALELVVGLMVARLHGHAIFGVVSVSDTETGTMRWIPMSGGVSLFFFFFFASPTRLRHSADAAPTRRRRGSDASDTPAVKKKKFTDFDR